MHNKVFKSSHATQSGFSLVELMIVVGIIGILAAMAIPRFQKFQAKARMAEGRNMLNHIFTLEESYHLETNTYLAFGAVGANLGGGNPTCSNAASEQLGLEFSPCTSVNPRYRYQTTNVANSTFTATATSGNGDNNVVCPGDGTHRWQINETRNITFFLGNAQRAAPSCD